MRLSNALSSLSLLAVMAAPALARDITGEMAYRERIALAEDAQLLVELRGPEGTVAEARIETMGGQVPLRFAIIAPDNGDYTLRGAIFVGGRPEWVSAPVAVAAGDGGVDLGLVPLTRPQALFGARMACGDRTVEIAMVGDGVQMRAGGDRFDLVPVASGSGAKYEDGANEPSTFWSKGNGALVSIRGTDLPECQPMIPDPVLPVTLRGNEPFWRLDLAETGYTFQPNLDAIAVSGALPMPVATAEGLRFDLAEGLSVTLDRRVCRDSMSGMPFPVTARVDHDGKTLSGCGGKSDDLLAGGWRVTQMGALAVPAEVELTIGFDPATGRVFGKSACNRYNGAYTLTGEGLSFGPSAVTMMACPDELMKLEQGFHKELAGITGFDVTDAGVLELRQGDKAVILAERP